MNDPRTRRVRPELVLVAALVALAAGGTALVIAILELGHVLG
jgi:hypothetical protein